MRLRISEGRARARWRRARTPQKRRLDQDRARQRRPRYRGSRLALGEGATSLDASPELLAARVREVAVLSAAQVGIAVGKVDPLPEPRLVGHWW